MGAIAAMILSGKLETWKQFMQAIKPETLTTLNGWFDDIKIYQGQ